MKLTPNVKRLMIEKMSLDAVPSGGGLADAMAFLSSPGKLSAGAKAAQEWTKLAILAVRSAAEPNPWRDESDEVIAGGILKRIAERRAKR